MTAKEILNQTHTPILTVPLVSFFGFSGKYVTVFGARVWKY